MRFIAERDSRRPPSARSGFAAPRQGTSAADLAFLVAAGVDRNVIAAATERAFRLHVEPHRVLLAEGVIAPQRYVEAVGAHLRVPVIHLGHLPLGPVDLVDGTHLPPGQLARLIAAQHADGRSIALATTELIDSLEAKQVRGARLRLAVRGLRGLDPELSAAGPIHTWQLFALAIVGGLSIGSAFVAPAATRMTLMLAVSLPFLLVVLFRFLVMLTMARQLASAVAALARPAIPDHQLPSYSVLVPLFRERAVLPDLIEALSRIDYPAAKLDCILVLEASDPETIAAARSTKLPAFMRIVVVPDCLPRTKPKALNYALQLARGELVAVYDAEDVPDPKQLRMAVEAFAKGGARVVCVQAVLAIHNADDSWLTRQFALEYASLFRGLLPALARFRLPIPLGGTSNHFRRSFLEAAGGWDPHNVTEDADLGMRIARRGGRIATIGSLTWEEAPAKLKPWIRQRTRWLKGWFQTYLVHMRSPAKLLREIGPLSFLAFQALMGGILLSCLLHPLFYAWMAWEIWTGEFLMPSVDIVGHGLLALACFNLVAGIGSAMVTAALAADRRLGAPSLFNVLLMPFYWLLVSLAAWRALFQLGFAPHVWEKTEHAARRRKLRHP